MPVTRQGDTTIMTPETVQAMIDQALQRNSTNTRDDGSQNSGGGPGRPVQPARMKSVFHISGCAIDNQVKFATCTLLGAALTWWNGHVRTLGHDAAYAMTWEILKKKTEKVDKYISGLPDNIHENYMSARPKTLDDAIELANDLMDQKLRTYAKRQAENKIKLDNNNQAQQQLLKKQNVVQAYAVGKIEEEVYVCQPPGFEDPDFPDRVYKVEKALYRLHQAPRAWYETLSTYMLDNGVQRGKIDKTLFIKRHKGDILLVQVYVDDIIFGLTKKE
ncbi:reverse transcriptase domain-containing protein [Tanacetum coccineum]